MNKWKHFGLAVLGASLLTLAPSFANADYYGQDSCNPCECDPCDVDFCNVEVGVDFLYWKPCVDDLEYASEFDDVRDVWRYHDICPEWEPGVRVMVALPNFFCGWGASASYTYIKSDDKGSVARDNAITSPLVHSDILTNVGSWILFDSARGSWDMDYHEWDLLLSYNISCNRCHLFSPFFGIAGLHLDQSLSAQLAATIGTNEYTIDAKWKSDFWGVGFRAGTAYEYRMSNCLRVFASTNATILAGEADSKLNSNYAGIINDEPQTFSIVVKDDDCCQIVSGWHVGAGIIYDTCICDCWDFSAKIGYEFLVWHNMPNHRVFAESSVSQETHGTSSNVKTIGFHGLMAGVALNF